VTTNGRRVLAKEVIIKTATVDVKSLTLNGKQVTLSVFRQIQKGELLDKNTLELQGVPWGWVNYFWKPCEPDHLHVVWQVGDELRRSCIYPSPSGARLNWYREELRDRLSSHVDFQLLNGLRRDHQIFNLSYVVGEESVPVYLDDTQQRVICSPYSKVKVYAKHANGDTNYSEWHEEDSEQMKQYLTTLQERTQMYESDAQLWSEYIEPLAEELRDYKARWVELYKTIEATDHLFIAV
jgi:hypothetical protein